MTEYDYSEEGRRRYMATQKRIAKWVDNTESAPQLKSPFAPRSNTGSDATARPPPHGPSRLGPGSHRPSTMQYSRGPATMTQHTYRASHAGSRPPPSALRSQFSAHPPPSPSHGASRAAPTTVYPSESISQAPMQRSQNSSSSQHSRSTHRSSASSSHSHHTHHHHRAPTYIISPPPSPAGSQGVIILPRRGKAPRVVVRVPSLPLLDVGC